jgi:hypothetical protein
MSAQSPLTAAELRFAERVVRRQRVFLALSVASVVVAAGLAAYYAYRKVADPAFPIGPRAVIVLLILLNARMNLRQYRYAGVLRQLMQAPTTMGFASRVPGP